MTTQDAIQKQAAKQRRQLGLNSSGTKRLAKSRRAWPWWLLWIFLLGFFRMFHASCSSENARKPDYISPQTPYTSSVESILKRMGNATAIDRNKKGVKPKVILNAEDLKGLTEEDFKNLGLDVKIQKAAPSDRGGSSGQPPVKPPSK